MTGWLITITRESGMDPWRYKWELLERERVFLWRRDYGWAFTHAGAERKARRAHQRRKLKLQRQADQTTLELR